MYRRRGSIVVATALLTMSISTLSENAQAHGDAEEPTHEFKHGEEGPPEDLPFVAGAPAPKGYHYEKGPRTGAMIPGAVFFGLAYLPALSLAVACLGTECRGSSAGKGWETSLAIPVVGPLVYAAGRCGGDHDRSCYFGTAAWILDAAVQAGGLALFLHGTRTREIWIRDRVAVSIAPSTYDGRGLGLGLVGIF